jgi:hypothetical protein
MSDDRPKSRYIVIIVTIWVVSVLAGSFGQFMPQTQEGELQWYDNYVLRALAHPSAWLAIGVGASALIAFFVLANRSDTLRAAIAAATTVAFLGLLLYPVWFSDAVDQGMREELVWAWTIIVVFYFGTEGAVQGTRIVQQRKALSSGVEAAVAEEAARMPGDGASRPVR